MFCRLGAVFIFAAGVCPHAVATSDYIGEWEKVRKTVLNPCKPRAMDVVDSYLHYLDVPGKSMGVQQQSELAMDLLFFIATGTLSHMSFIASTPKNWTPEEWKTFGISKTRNATPLEKQTLVRSIVVTAYYLQNYAPHFQRYLESVKITSREKTTRESRHFNCVIGTFKHAMQKLGVQAFEQPDSTSLRAVRQILSLNSIQGTVPLDTFIEEVLKRYRPRSSGTESLDEEAEITSPPTPFPPPPPPPPPPVSCDHTRGGESGEKHADEGSPPSHARQHSFLADITKGTSLRATQEITRVPSPTDKREQGLLGALRERFSSRRPQVEGSETGSDMGSEKASTWSSSAWSVRSTKRVPPRDPPPPPPRLPSKEQTSVPSELPPPLPGAKGTEGQVGQALSKSPPKLSGAPPKPQQPAAVEAEKIKKQNESKPAVSHVRIVSEAFRFFGVTKHKS